MFGEWLRVAQTLTVAKEGLLGEVRFQIYCNNAGPGGAKLALFDVGEDGTPSGSMLAQLKPYAGPVRKVVVMDDVPYFSVFVPTASLAVRAGQRLAIVAEPAPQDGCHVVHSMSDVYAGGGAYLEQKNTSGSAAAVSWSGGKTDLPFQLLLQVPGGL